MAYNGSGTFTLVAGNPVVTGTTISSTWANNTLNDIATGLSTAITKDGQTTPTANIPMGGYKITGLGAATANGNAVRYEDVGLFQQTQLFVAFTTGGTSTAYTLTPTPAITAYTAGQSFWVTFNAASGAAPTLAISGVATPPNLVKQLSDGTYGNVAANDIPINHRGKVTLLSATQALVELPQAKSGNNSDITSLSILPGYLYGCTMSTAGASADMSIAAGRATDSTGVQSMALSAITKNTGAWAVGTAAGGKSLAAAIANNTWYHFYVIRRPDTGVVDVCFSTNATGLVAADFVAGGGNVPDAYTQFRRIGAGKTNGSAQWTRFFQRGGVFLLHTPVTDIAATNPGFNGVTGVLPSIPLGIPVDALLNIGVIDSAGSDLAYVSALSQSDMAPSLTAAPGVSVKSHTSTAWGYSPITVTTDSAQSIRYRLATGGVNSVFRAVTLGWIDDLGKSF